MPIHQFFSLMKLSYHTVGLPVFHPMSSPLNFVGGCVLGSNISCFFSFSAFQEENTTDPPQSVQKGVNDLVDAALSPRNLCMMDPTWHPWF